MVGCGSRKSWASTGFIGYHRASVSELCYVTRVFPRPKTLLAAVRATVEHTLPSQSILEVLSSGRAVEQSMMVWIPTSAAGSDVGSFRSACTRGNGSLKIAARHLHLHRAQQIRQTLCIPHRSTSRSPSGRERGDCSVELRTKGGT